MELEVSAWKILAIAIRINDKLLTYCQYHAKLRLSVIIFTWVGMHTERGRQLGAPHSNKND